MVAKERVNPRDMSQLYYDRLQYLSKKEKVEAIGELILDYVELKGSVDPAKLLAVFWHTPYFTLAIEGLGVKIDMRGNGNWRAMNLQGDIREVEIPGEAINSYLGEE